MLRAVVQAAIDAGRAWAIMPNHYRNAGYARAENGGVRIRYRRRFRVGEVLGLKLHTATRVFVASVKLAVARDVVVSRYAKEGLLANLLHVLEVVRRVRPDARVYTSIGCSQALRWRFDMERRDRMSGLGSFAQ